MSTWKQKLEVTTNIVILSLCLLIGVVFAKNVLVSRREASVEPKSLVGQALSIREVDWTATSRTIVLFLSTKCHFCSESLPFYRRLATVASAKHIRVLAVFPQTSAEANSFLQEAQVSVSQVVQSTLSGVDIRGTPTLLIVDSRGRIDHSWAGKLSRESEEEVLGSL